MTPPPRNRHVRRAVFRAASIALLAIGVHACDPFGIFWSPDHWGKNNVIVPGRATKITWGGKQHQLRAQVPGQPTLFVGAYLQGNFHRLRLFLMDFDTFQATAVHDIFSPSQQGTTLLGDCGDEGCSMVGGDMGAYDPDVISFGNKTWIAFECEQLWSTTEGPLSPRRHSTCLGPVDLSQPNGLDLANTVVAVRGEFDVQTGIRHSASMPKLLSHNDKAYLYWTVVHGDFAKLTTRGVELALSPDGLRLLPKNAGGSLATIDSYSSDSEEVWGVEINSSSDTYPRSNAIADVTHVFSAAGTVYALGSVGGAGCKKPYEWSTSSGCYRLAIAKSASPLGHRIFNTDQVPDSDLPDNSAERPRVISTPKGWMIVAQFRLSLFPGGDDPSSFLELPGTAESCGPDCVAPEAYWVLGLPLFPASPQAAVTDYLTLP
jgi:hypothetical protein